MRCDGSADPTISGEINTYINLEREDNSGNSIEEVLPKCRHTREVSYNISIYIIDAYLILLLDIFLLEGINSLV